MELLNFHQISHSPAGLKAEDFASIAALLNLAMHDADDAIAEEGSLVSKAGMSYFHLPVPWEAPTADHLKTFIGIMDALEDKKILVHCQVNARVSAFMLKYLTFKGVAETEATTNGKMVAANGR